MKRKIVKFVYKIIENKDKMFFLNRNTLIITCLYLTRSSTDPQHKIIFQKLTILSDPFQLIKSNFKPLGSIFSKIMIIWNINTKH